MELFRDISVQQAIDALSAAGDEQRGAVFTSAPVVNALLDLSGYTSDRPLHEIRLLEPSFGQGHFLEVALDRLIDAWLGHGGQLEDALELRHCIRAVEIHEASCVLTRQRLAGQLTARGLSQQHTDLLLDAWLIQDDFLLTRLHGEFEVIVGNPPYVRQELIPEVLLKTYRKHFTTVYDRADLYVPFFEQSLRLLSPGGRLGFICTNRWLKNKYGGPLRAMLAGSCHLTHYIDMMGVDAFNTAVISYPAITVFERDAEGPTRVVERPSLVDLPDIVASMRNGGPAHDKRVIEVNDVTSGSDPWLLDALGQLRLLRRLERTMPTLEETGCQVGIGVATGCDEVYIGPYDELDVEEARKLKLLKPADIATGSVAWSGLGVINPFEPSGELASLEAWPRFGAHMRAHERRLKKRHVARNNPSRWTKTIDRIDPELTCTPKLLIPDIKGEPTVAYDPGHFYPHHNLYVLTADQWDLQALQAVLRTDIAMLFVAAYSVRMSGGYLRFQAQYLRRIRLPAWEGVDDPTRRTLRAVATAPLAEVSEVVFKLYGLTRDEAAQLTSWAAQMRPNKR